MFAEHGAHVLSADEIGRELMQPGEPVYAAVIAHFGNSIVAPDGTLDRAALARIAFAKIDQNRTRIEELNAIVHPAVIARQADLIDQIAAHHPNAVVIVESALIFETRHGGPAGWHTRFDRIIFVRASEDLKIARFIRRAASSQKQTREDRQALEDEARRRLAIQSEGERNAAHCDYILTNSGSLEDLAAQVDALWPVLRAAANPLLK